MMKVETFLVIVEVDFVELVVWEYGDEIVAVVVGLILERCEGMVVGEVG
jgi:hypothetical protein